jgi:hypothetical protein
MEIAHQLPGRVRVRMPGLKSKDFCEKIIEKLSNDDRISGQRISTGCNSLIVSFDPLRCQTEDLLSLLAEGKPLKKKKPVASKPSKAAAARKAPSASKKVKAAAKTQKGAASRYFKPAVSSDVQEKIRIIISHEDPQKPCSDGKISEMLKAEKVDIARRTVAKYREMMGIPPSSKRRKKDLP